MKIIKSLESTFSLYAAVFSAFGSMLMSFAKVSLAAVPMIRSVSTTFKLQKYAYLQTRLNRIRDAAIVLLTELVTFHKELTLSVECNPGDFVELKSFKALLEQEAASYDTLVKEISGKAAVHQGDMKEGMAAVTSWISESPALAGFEVATLGPIVEVTVNEFTTILEAHFYTTTGSKLSADMLVDGATPGELLDILEKAKKEFTEAELSKVHDDITKEGVSRVILTGIRYVIR